MVYFQPGNQLANWIVSKFGEAKLVDGNLVNPTGYQTVLIVTGILYVVAFLISMFMVKPMKEKAE